VRECHGLRRIPRGCLRWVSVAPTAPNSDVAAIAISTTAIERTVPVVAGRRASFRWHCRGNHAAPCSTSRRASAGGEAWSRDSASFESTHEKRRAGKVPARARSNGIAARRALLFGELLPGLD